MRIADDISTIGWLLGPDVEEILYDGLPGGSEEGWGYDQELVADIASACRKWQERHPEKTVEVTLVEEHVTLAKERYFRASAPTVTDDFIVMPAIDFRLYTRMT